MTTSDITVFYIVDYKDRNNPVIRKVSDNWSECARWIDTEVSYSPTNKGRYECREVSCAFKV